MGWKKLRGMVLSRRLRYRKLFYVDYEYCLKKNAFLIERGTENLANFACPCLRTAGKRSLRSVRTFRNIRGATKVQLSVRSHLLSPYSDKTEPKVHSWDERWRDQGVTEARCRLKQRLLNSFIECEGYILMIGSRDYKKLVEIIVN